MSGPVDVLAAMIADADLRCNKWLADGNAVFEDGKPRAAQRCYAKSQYWLDRRNRLEERAALANVGSAS
jgi:hypothetical protein